MASSLVHTGSFPPHPPHKIKVLNKMIILTQGTVGLREKNGDVFVINIYFFTN